MCCVPSVKLEVVEETTFCIYCSLSCYRGISRQEHFEKILKDSFRRVCISWQSNLPMCTFLSRQVRAGVRSNCRSSHDVIRDGGEHSGREVTTVSDRFNICVNRFGTADNKITFYFLHFTTITKVCRSSLDNFCPVEYIPAIRIGKRGILHIKYKYSKNVICDKPNVSYSHLCICVTHANSWMFTLKYVNADNFNILSTILYWKSNSS